MATERVRSTGTSGVLPLVGRDEVLADLDAVFDRARGSRGALVTLMGEAGIGKTRLAAEAAARAHGFRMIWSWCAPDPALGSFRPWVQVVRELAATHARAAHLVAESPYLVGLLSHGAVPVDAFADAEALLRVQFFDTVAEVIRGAAESEPLLIVLDDVHDAQESSLWLLAHLVATLLRQATALRLVPLNDHQIADLITRAAGAEPSSDLVQQVLARSDGNPLLVGELVRWLAERRPVGRDDIGGAVPESLRATTAERMVRFSPQGQRLVSAAAVLGTRFDLDALAAMAEVPLADVRTGLREARQAGLVDLTEPGSGRFVHELIRDAVYDRLATAEQSRWHEVAGSFLAVLAERGRDVGPAAVAHHLLLAGPHSAGKAARFAQRAGTRSAELLAYEDAANWYERALLALDLAGADGAQRATVLLALGEARLGCGDRTRARAGFLKAAALAREADRPDVLARAALGLGSGQAGFEVGLLDQEQLDLLHEARDLLPAEQPALRSLVTARLSVATTMVASDERRLTMAEEALSLARQAADDGAQAYALAALCDALAGPDHHAARLGYALEIVERATRQRNPALELLGRRLRLVALLEAGQRSAAEAEMIAYRIRAETFGHPLYRWYIPLWRGMWALAEGRFADCRGFNELVEAEGNTAGSHNAFLLAVTQRWCLLGEMEDRAGIDELFRGIDFEQIGGLWARVSHALVLAQLGDPGAARARLDAVAPLLESLPRDSEWLPCMAQVAETVGFIGPHPIARWAYDSLLPFSELFAVEGIGAAIRGPVHRHLALLAAALGEPERARQHSARALDAARALGAPQLVARIQREAQGSAPGAAVSENLFQRNGELWTVRFAERQVQLRDSKGIRDLVVLLARPGVQVAALDLATAVIAGDTGEVLDTSARQAYRQRLVELEQDANDADAAGDIGRASLIAAERDALIEQLTAAYGLGGRARRAGSTAERARTAVTARIRVAVKRIEDAHAELGLHLAHAVRTGTFCVYEPEVSTRWRVTV